jgi:hypothetical protein
MISIQSIIRTKFAIWIVAFGAMTEVSALSVQTTSAEAKSSASEQVLRATPMDAIGKEISEREKAIEHAERWLLNKDSQLGDRVAWIERHNYTSIRFKFPHPLFLQEPSFEFDPEDTCSNAAKRHATIVAVRNQSEAYSKKMKATIVHEQKKIAELKDQQTKTDEVRFVVPNAEKATEILLMLQELKTKNPAFALNCTIEICEGGTANVAPDGINSSEPKIESNADVKTLLNQ